jgi:hypothetical protein
MNQSVSMEGCCCAAKQEAMPQKPIVKVKKTAKTVPSIILSILIAFFPKCPVCWAVYMSMFGSLGLAQLPYMSWLLPVLLGFLGLHLLMLFKKGKKNGYLPFIISLAGATIILAGRTFFPAEKWVLFTGMGCIISGSLLNSLSTLRLEYALTKSISN